mmetsp:Transcript_11352/g.42594  ORF Transcript_11352/g.42594 Transcript_11352/m.42594 type:complete len:641 (-) Transcript_11352:1487-3409(-)
MTASNRTPTVTFNTDTLNDNVNHVGAEDSLPTPPQPQKETSVSRLLATHQQTSTGSMMKVNRRRSGPVVPPLKREWSLSTIQIGAKDADSDDEAEPTEDFFEWKRRVFGTKVQDTSNTISVWDRIVSLLLFCQTSRRSRNDYTSPYRRLQIFVWNVFEQTQSTLLGKIVNIIIISLVLLSALIFVIQTESVLTRIDWLMWICFVCEMIITALFMAEYLLRLWSCTVHPYYRRLGWLLGRVRFVISLGPLIDLIAIVPSFIYIFAAVIDCASEPTNCLVFSAGSLGIRNIVVVRILRFSRLGRLPKLDKHLGIFSSLKSIVIKKRSELITGVILLSCAVFFVATGIYLCEKDEQPDDFGSIIRSFYFTFIAVSSIGLGDVYPKTIYGKTFSCVIAVLAITIIAVLTSILGAAFMEHLNEMRMRDKHKMKIMHLELLDIVDAIVQSEKHLKVPLDRGKSFSKKGTSGKSRGRGAYMSFRRTSRVASNHSPFSEDTSYVSSHGLWDPVVHDDKRTKKRRTKRRTQLLEHHSDDDSDDDSSEFLKPGQICCPHCRKSIDLQPSRADDDSTEDESEEGGFLDLPDIDANSSAETTTTSTESTKSVSLAIPEGEQIELQDVRSHRSNASDDTEGVTKERILPHTAV